MPKRGVHPENDEWAAALRPAHGARPTKKWSSLAIGLGVGLVVYLLLCLFVLGPAQPALFQRFLALVFAGLAVGLYVALTRQSETPEETMLRLRRGRHADFGKQLRAQREQRRTLVIPGIGPTTYRFWGGLGVFLLAVGWWLTPWAPVGVKQPEVQDLTIPLGQTIAAAELVMPDGHTAVCLPPVVHERARKIANSIPDSAGAYERALQRIVEGRFSDAEKLLTVAERSGEAGPERISLARAQGFMYAGQFPEALAEYQNTLRRNPNDVFLLCQAATACLQAGNPAAAEPLIARAAEVTKADSHTDDPARGFYLHVQALFHLSQGNQYDEAEKHFKQSRDIWEAALPDNGTLAAISRNNQGVVYLLRARYSAARELIDWSREGRQTAHGRAAALGNLGMLLYLQGNLEEAKTQFELARAALANGPEGSPVPVSAVNRSQLALWNWARWHYEAGRKYGEAALQQCNESVGAEHPLSAPVLGTLATLYRVQSFYAKAEPYYFRALSIVRHAHGDQHPYAAAILLRVSELHLARKNYREAEQAIAQATDIIEKAFGDKHPALVDALNVRGELELALERPRDARRPLERALEIVEDVYGKRHPSAARTLGNLAAIETSPRTYKRGVAFFEEALTIAEAVLGPEHPESARLHGGLASLYAGQGAYADARPAAERCLAIREKVLVSFHPDLAAACEQLADVLENLARPETERAAELRSRAKAIRQRHARENRADAP